MLASAKKVTIIALTQRTRRFDAGTSTAKPFSPATRLSQPDEAR